MRSFRVRPRARPAPRVAPDGTRRSGRRGRSAIALRAAALALAALAIGAVPALADTELGHGGLVGEHRLRDIAGYPGVHCHLSGDLDEGRFGPLRRIVVRAPVVFARDVGPEEDLRYVGYRARLQRQTFDASEDPQPTSPWRTVRVKPIVKRLATELRPADFRSQSFAIDSPGRDRFRVIVDLFWFSPSGRIEGGAAHLVNNHRILVGGRFFLDQARPCDDAQ